MSIGPVCGAGHSVIGFKKHAISLGDAKQFVSTNQAKLSSPA